MNNCWITIFTPTFNRCVYLKKLYGSLLRQSDRRFIWLIVDDGSSDDTSAQVRSWQGEGKISIEYIYQENGGKHAAHNTGVKNTKTAYFFCVDSDDELPENSIKTVCEAIPDTLKRPDIAGIIAKKGYLDGEDQCTELPDTISEVSIRDIYKIHQLKGELALIFKTEVLKEFLFPVFPGERFVTESVILNRISMKYKMNLLNKVIYMGEYIPDGYTKNLSQVHKSNPKGFHYYLLQEIELARTASELKHALSNYIAGCWKIGYKVQLDFKCRISNLPGAILLFLKLRMKERIIRSDFFRAVLKRMLKTKYL